jgi:uroporphyrinogen-III synthase
VSQPKPATGKSPYFDIAEKHNVQIDFCSFIKVEGVTAKEFRQQKVSILNHTAIVFLSRHAIDHFFTLCKELRVTIPDDMKYFCLSETISLYIQKYVQYRKRKVFFGNGHIQDLDPLFAKHKTETYFVPMSNVHNSELNELFDKYGIKRVETTAILETNSKSLANFADLERIQHKRRRAYITAI